MTRKTCFFNKREMTRDVQRMEKKEQLSNYLKITSTYWKSVLDFRSSVTINNFHITVSIIIV